MRYQDAPGRATRRVATGRCARQAKPEPRDAVAPPPSSAARPAG